MSVYTSPPVPVKRLCFHEDRPVESYPITQAIASLGSIPSAPSQDAIIISMRKVDRQFNVVNVPSSTSMLKFIEENHKNIKNGNSFHVMDLRIVEKQMLKWRSLFPRVDPFYAMKCNTDPALLATLFTHGAGFDCASKREISIALDLGCPPKRIIFANPAKFRGDLEFAAANQIEMMTFDSEDELQKVATTYFDPTRKVRVTPKLVLRIVTDDRNAQCRLSTKFGAAIEDTEYLLQAAQKLNIPVVGVSFHCGSGCTDVHAFVDAITNARKIFDVGLSMGHPMHLLDLGGGYPGDDSSVLRFSTIAEVVNPVLDRLFPPTKPNDLNGDGTTSYPSFHIIAEPGRYFCHSSMMFSSPIIARRLTRSLPSFSIANAADEQNMNSGEGMHITHYSSQGGANPVSFNTAASPETYYYIGDGVYGAFNSILYDHYHPRYPYIISNSTRGKPLNVLPLVTSDVHGEGEYAITARKEVPLTFSSSLHAYDSLRFAKVFGPTCDGLDCIFQNIPLPPLDVNDWLVFPDMGAYTVAAQSSFNGIARPEVIYIRTQL